jgi:prepilin-type N-terminal cleavage/methylation domain-containing protein
MTPRPSIPCARPRPSGFSLLEVMVAVSLLAVIIVGLLAMFFQVQRAFRAGTSQSDLMESGRAVMNLLTRELQEAAAARQPWMTNVAIVPPFGLADGQEASSQVLPAGEGRNNYLKDLTFLSRQNDDWVFTAYRMTNASSGVGTLCRLVARETTNNPFFLHDALATASPEPAAGRNFNTNFHRLVDGVVHFYIEAYDSRGLVMTNALLGNFLGSYAFTNRVMPAYLDIELGVLDPSTLEKFKARAEADPATAKSQYLPQRAGRVQMFRQRVVLRAPASEGGF